MSEKMWAPSEVRKQVRKLFANCGSEAWFEHWREELTPAVGASVTETYLLPLAKGTWVGPDTLQIVDKETKVFREDPHTQEVYQSDRVVTGEELPAFFRSRCWERDDTAALVSWVGQILSRGDFSTVEGRNKILDQIFGSKELPKEFTAKEPDSWLATPESFRDLHREYRSLTLPDSVGPEVRSELAQFCTAELSRLLAGSQLSFQDIEEIAQKVERLHNKIQSLLSSDSDPVGNSENSELVSLWETMPFPDVDKLELPKEQKFKVIPDTSGLYPEEYRVVGHVNPK